MPSGEFGPEDTFIGARGGNHVTIKQLRWQADTASTGSFDWMTNRLSLLHPSSFLFCRSSIRYLPFWASFWHCAWYAKDDVDFLGQKTRAVAFEWNTYVKHCQTKKHDLVWVGEWVCGAEAHPMSTWRGSWPVESLVKAESVWENVWTCFQSNLFSNLSRTPEFSFQIIPVGWTHKNLGSRVWGWCQGHFFVVWKGVCRRNVSSHPNQKTAHTPRQNVGFVKSNPQSDSNSG